MYDATYVCLCVTAIRARAMSSGYVIIDAVEPASEPAINRYAGGTLLHDAHTDTVFFTRQQSN